MGCGLWIVVKVSFWTPLEEKLKGKKELGLQEIDLNLYTLQLVKLKLNSDYAFDDDPFSVDGVTNNCSC